MNEKEIIERLQQLRAGDYSFESGRILSSVSTSPLEIALDAFRMFADTNALDVNIFPSVLSLEGEVIEWFGNLLNNPGISGYITTGGTEANIAALWAAKRIYKNKGNTKNKRNTKKEIIAPESAHYSIQKMADLMDLKVRYVPLDENFRADIGAVRDELSDDTLAVIATAGTSALGIIDPIEEINELCEDVFFHVDAAFGGFVIPFLGNSSTPENNSNKPENNSNTPDMPNVPKSDISNVPRIDFTLDNLDSITIDPHKMGAVPIPAGAILFRDKSYMGRLSISPTYLPFDTSTLLGSRSGGAIAATWATLMYLGFDGYKKIVGTCMDNTRFLCSEIEKIDGASLVTVPDLNVVGIKIRDSGRVCKAITELGWNIWVDRNSETMRVVVMPHVTREVIQEFIRDLKNILGIIDDTVDETRI